MTDKETILDEASRITRGDRQASYGTPLSNHGLTAELWSAYLVAEITPRDVCILNILQKISREARGPKRDNLVDIAGYARNAEMIEDEEARRDAGDPHDPA